MFGNRLFSREIGGELTLSYLVNSKRELGMFTRVVVSVSMFRSQDALTSRLEQDVKCLDLVLVSDLDVSLSSRS